MMPWQFSKPAGLITLPIEAETLLRKCSRLPADFVHLLDRLRREFRRGDVEEDVGVGRFQLDDVGVDGRLRDLVAFLGDDHRGRLGAEPVLQALEVVLAVIVVLVEDRDLGVRLFLQEILRIDLRLRSGSWAASPWSRGSSSGSFHLVAPVATNSCGTFFVFMYFWIAEFGGVPSGLEQRTAPRRSRPACAPARPSSAGCSRRHRR